MVYAELHHVRKIEFLASENLLKGHARAVWLFEYRGGAWVLRRTFAGRGIEEN